MAKRRITLANYREFVRQELDNHFARRAAFDGYAKAVPNPAPWMESLDLSMRLSDYVKIARYTESAPALGLSIHSKAAYAPWDLISLPGATFVQNDRDSRPHFSGIELRVYFWKWQVGLVFHWGYAVWRAVLHGRWNRDAGRVYNRWLDEARADFRKRKDEETLRSRRERRNALQRARRKAKRDQGGFDL